MEAACKEYLLDLDLSLEQLCQLVFLWDRLGNISALKATLRKLMRKPWLTPVAQAVACVFQHLLQGDGTRLEAARKVLQSPSCGKMCELQVNSLFKCVCACQPSKFCYITLHYITLHYITLHYITSHYITLHYITLYYLLKHRKAARCRIWYTHAIWHLPSALHACCTCRLV